MNPEVQQMIAELRRFQDSLETHTPDERQEEANSCIYLLMAEVDARGRTVR